MKAPHFLICFFALFFLFSSVQVVSAQEEYAYVGQWCSGGFDGQFVDPWGVAVDSAGNVYVADTHNNRIQKFSSNGTFITKWGKSRGVSAGPENGSFQRPLGIAVDTSDNVYVVDSGNYRIQKFTSNGTFITKWGSMGSGEGQFWNPMGIAVDTTGNVYVADSLNYRIQKFTSNGSFIMEFGQFAEGAGPCGIAVDRAGFVYVADSYGFQIQKFTSTGSSAGSWKTEYGTPPYNMYPVIPYGVAVDGAGNVYVTGVNRVLKYTSTGLVMWGGTGPGLEGYGSGDGQFDYPQGIAVDSAGNVYVADAGNHRIQKFSSTGTFITKWGDYGAAVWFDDPVGVAVDSTGNVYVADRLRHNLVHKFTSSGTFIQMWMVSYPYDVAVDSASNVYVTGPDDDRIRKFTSTGTFITEWGSSGSGDGQLDSPRGIAVDSAGNVYVADIGNGRVQKFTSSGTFIQKWVVSSPYDVAVDGAGNVYVTGDGSDRIQKFSSNGTFITKWGSTGSGDGQFRGTAMGIAVDSAGNVYVADTHNNRIQKFSSNGTFITKWGSLGSGGGQFGEYGPVGIAVDTAGDVYVADTGNYRIQKFTSIGTSVYSITPDAATSTVEDVGVTVRGTGFTPGTTFQLVNATLGTITCKSGTSTRVSDTELRGNLSFADVKEGLYDVVVTTPGGTTDRLENGFQVNPVPVVLVHGWRSGPGMWDAFESALKEEGIPYWNFGYDGTADPTLSAYGLVGFIREQRSTYRPDLYPNGYTGKIDIVCHSMGAIVSRWSMEALGHGNEVRQWIGIAPAHGGSAGADLLDITIVDGPIHWLISWALGPAATEQLKTTSNSVQYLKTDALSDSTTYRVIAGWNPYHSNSFGNLFLSATFAKAPDGTLYRTFNGDMIVAQAQSYREGMGFECFPIQNDPDGGNDEPRSNFDHTSIHHSKAVIKRVIKYLKNPETPNEVRRPADYLSPDPLMRIDLVKLVKGTIVSASQENVETFSFGAGTAATDVLVAELEWTDGSLSLELTDPNGQTFTTATSTSTAWSLSDSNHRLFTIASPATGSWSAKVIPLSVPGHPIGYNLTVYRPSLNGTPPSGTPTPTATPITTPTAAVGPPVANFTWDPVNVTNFVPIRFTDTSTGSPTAWCWTEDGVEVGSSRIVWLTFQKPGTRSVSLKVMNANGWSAPKTVIINATQRPGTPGANFTWSPSNVTAGVPIQFADTSTNTPFFWRWVQDGVEVPFSGPNPVLTFPTPGTVTISLEAVNSLGWSAPKTLIITVADPAAIPTPTVKPIAGGGSPTDTNADGTYDDVNGNGRKDFADVVLYFNQMTWIAGNEPTGLFDYNGNGRVDFADVVWLFNHL